MPQILKQYYKWIIFGGVVCALILFVLYLFIPSRPTIPVEAKPLDPKTEKPLPKKINEVEDKPIFVDVKGEVNKPGIYKAKIGERTNDLIQRAGGFNSNAEEKNVNLAQKVQDEMVIYVPAIGEKTNSILTPLQEDESETKVNLNEGSEDDLMKIPGIGPSKARSIIEYREKEGPFKSIEEIKNVSGIGEKTYEQLKGSISIN